MDNIVYLDNKAKELEPFMVDRSNYVGMDDLLPIENVEKVRIK